MPMNVNWAAGERPGRNFKCVVKCLSVTSIFSFIVLTLARQQPVEGNRQRENPSWADHGAFVHQTEAAILSAFSTSNSSINFTHVTVDPISGRIYVGATNWLYQLNANLTLEHSVRTGPVEDSPNCSPSDCSGVDDHLIRLTKNVNKILVIDPSSRMLIVCGSVHQGACRRHSLSDVRQAEPLVGVPVAANDENSSTVAFVGLAKYYGNSVTNVLYVGATNSRLGPYRDVVPAISSRSLDSGPRLFSIFEESFTDTARVDISYHLRDYFIVKYVHGFHSRDFIYFATVQKKSHFRALEEWGSVSRLARVCATDAGYHSYTEMTIQCLGPDGTDYTLLQDASVVRVSSNLARNLGINEGDEVFMGVFAQGKDHSTQPAGASALCVFPMTEIERGFLANIHLCYNGSVSSRNMDYIAGSVNECPEPRSGNVGSFCNEAIKLNGSLPLSTQALISYPNITLTAVIGVTTGPHTAALVGTSSGIIKKILISSAFEGEEYDEIIIDAGHPILGDIYLDKTKEYIYTASPYKVVKIPVERCSQFCKRFIHPSSPFKVAKILTERCSEYCPSFRHKEILIPHGARRELSIDVRNLDPSRGGLECIIEIEGARERVPARLIQDKIICAENSYTYQADVAEMSAKLEVIKGGDTFIDRTNFTLYKCNIYGSHASRPDCSLCLNIDKRFNCVWCSNQCSYVDACPEQPAPSCPPPRIDAIYPLEGPVEGGTLITIEGSNLGANEDEIRGKIAVGGAPCTLVKYSPSVRLVCRTAPSPSGPQAGFIFVGNRAGITRAQEKFEYKSPGDINFKTQASPPEEIFFSHFNRTTNIHVTSRPELQDFPLNPIEPVIELTPSNSSALSEQHILSAAAVGAVFVLVLVTLVALVMKKNNRRSFSSPLTQVTDPDPKVPPPLITSTTKPLPLLPLTIDRHPGLGHDKGCERASLSPDSQVNAIYSEINDLTTDTSSGHISDNPLNQLSYTTRFNHAQLIHQPSRMPAPGPSYPPFITFNTIGRSRNKSNPYILTSDTMGRPPDHNSSSYAVYSCEKLKSRGSLRDKNSSFLRDRFV